MRKLLFAGAAIAIAASAIAMKATAADDVTIGFAIAKSG